MNTHLFEFPSTPLQRGMYVGAKRQPDSGQNVIQCLITGSNRYRINAIESSFITLTQSYPCLRINFSRIDNGVVRVLPEARFEVETREFTSRNSDEFLEWLDINRHQSYFEGSTPVCRITRVRFEDSDCLVLSLHHAIVDRTTIERLVEDWSSLYNGFVDDLPSTKLHTCPVSNNVSDAARLHAVSHSTSDRHSSIPANDHHDIVRHRSLRKRCSASDVHGINALLKLDVSRTALAQLIWGMFLCRFTNTNACSFGTVLGIADHRTNHCNRHAGLGINTVPTQFHTGETVFSTLTSLQHRLTEARQYLGVDPDTLLHRIGNDLKFDTLISVNIKHVRNTATSGPNSEWKIELLEQSTAALSLGLTFDDGLMLDLEYDSGSWTEESGQGFIENLVDIVARLSGDPDQTISELRDLPLRQLREITTWERGKDKEKDTPFYCVLSTIERHCRIHPDVPAIRVADRCWSYGELWLHVEQIANVLTSRCVEASKPVYVIGHKSEHTIAAMLAIWYVGAVYIPISPAWPSARRQLVFSRHGQGVVLSTDGTDEPDDAHTQSVVNLCLIQTDEDVSPVRYSVDSGDVAYVMHTSGSTGLPKSVPVSHQAMHNLTTWAIDYYALSSKDNISQLSDFAFDASIEEIIPTLMSCATLSMRAASNDRIVDFQSWLKSTRVTVFQCPTALWNSWMKVVDTKQTPALYALRLVIIGGEAATPDAMTTWNKLFPDSVRLINSYGPTETTVTATAWKPGTWYSTRVRVPIGKPIYNVQARVVDAHGNRTPIGALGELQISGAGLSEGYIGSAPENGFFYDRQGTGTRLYATGDIASWNHLGELEYHGRRDNQIKIRGHRVQTEEVALCIGTLDGVTRVHIDVREHQLVAWIEGRIDENTVIDHCRDTLPKYAIPDRVVVLEKLPSNSSGKLDVASLTTFGGVESTRDSVATDVALLDPVVETVSRCFEAVLELDRIDLETSFFELGGTSLGAFLLIDELAVAGLSISQDDFFENPSVQFIAHKASSRCAENNPDIVELGKHHDIQRLYLGHSAPGDLLGYLDLVRGLDGVVDCYGMQSQGIRGPAHLLPTIEDAAKTFAAQIDMQRHHGPALFGGVCFGGHVALETARHFRRLGGRCDLLVLVECWPIPDRLSRIRRKIRNARNWFSTDSADIKHNEAPKLSTRSRLLRHRDAIDTHSTRMLRRFTTTNIDIPILLIRGRKDMLRTGQDDYGWSAYSPQVDVITIDASHSEVTDGRAGSEIASVLREAHMLSKQTHAPVLSPANSGNTSMIDRVDRESERLLR